MAYKSELSNRLVNECRPSMRANSTGAVQDMLIKEAAQRIDDLEAEIAELRAKLANEYD
jgi:hypothetical protein